jgi:hypothetical protein
MRYLNRTPRCRWRQGCEDHEAQDTVTDGPADRCEIEELRHDRAQASSSILQYSTVVLITSLRACSYYSI